MRPYLLLLADGEGCVACSALRRPHHGGCSADLDALAVAHLPAAPASACALFLTLLLLCASCRLRQHQHVLHCMPLQVWYQHILMTTKDNPAGCALCP